MLTDGERDRRKRAAIWRKRAKNLNKGFRQSIDRFRTRNYTGQLDKTQKKIDMPFSMKKTTFKRTKRDGCSRYPVRTPSNDVRPEFYGRW